MAEISPQGYIYGKEPKSRHPFWGGGGGDIDEYVKSLNGTITETEDGKVYKIEATDGDDVVSEVISILVPNPVDVGTYAENVSITSQHENNQTTYTISYHTSDNVDHIAGTVIVPDIPAPPTDYVTSVAIQKVETTTQDTYYFTYYTKDGESHGMGTIEVKKDYVQSVSVTGEEASGVNTITIDVDGDESSFDIPTQYVKNITQSAGEVEDDVYTFTDENGHTTDISAPGQYLQSFTSTVNDTTTGDESYTLGMRGIVSGTPANSSAFTAHLQTPAHNANSKYHIDFTNAAGDTAELEWEEGASIDLATGFKAAVVSGSIVAFPYNWSSNRPVVTCKYGTLNGAGSPVPTGTTATYTVKPQIVYIPTGTSVNTQKIELIPTAPNRVVTINSTTFSKNSEYENDTISCTVSPYPISSSLAFYNKALYDTTSAYILFGAIFTFQNTTKGEYDIVPAIYACPISAGLSSLTISEI